MIITPHIYKINELMQPKVEPLNETREEAVTRNLPTEHPMCRIKIFLFECSQIPIKTRFADVAIQAAV